MLEFVERVPISFQRHNCKNVLLQSDGLLQITYIYSDTRDLVLIVNTIDSFVITLYLTVGNN
jgi:hypothetical protein